MPVPVADTAAVELRGGRLLSRPVLLYAAGFALAAALTGCTTVAGPPAQGAAVRVMLSNGQPLDVIVVGGGRR